MEEKKIHLCDSCGGHLEVDLDRQIYVCPFCGVTYDYAYFKEDDVLQIAETYEERKELSAALDAYKFYLTKDPHDFRSLRKAMLLTYGLTDLNKLRRPDVLSKFDKDPKETEWVIESALEEDKEYFKTMQEIFVNAKRYHNLAPKLKTFDEQIKEEEGKVTRINGSIGGCTITTETENGMSYLDPDEGAGKKLFYSAVGVSFAGFVYALIANWMGWAIIAVIGSAIFFTGMYFIKVIPARSRKTELEATKRGMESQIGDIKEKRQRVVDELAGFMKNIKMLTMKLDERTKKEAEAAE